MYHVIQSEPNLYTVGTGKPGVDWCPVADHSSRDVAMADAERRNSPHIYALLEKAGRQIDEVIARITALEEHVTRSERVDNENNPDWQHYKSLLSPPRQR